MMKWMISSYHHFQLAVSLLLMSNFIPHATNQSLIISSSKFQHSWSGIMRNIEKEDERFSELKKWLEWSKNELTMPIVCRSALCRSVSWRWTSSRWWQRLSCCEAADSRCSTGCWGAGPGRGCCIAHWTGGSANFDRLFQKIVSWLKIELS